AAVLGRWVHVEARAGAGGRSRLRGRVRAGNDDDAVAARARDGHVRAVDDPQGRLVARGGERARDEAALDVARLAAERVAHALVGRQVGIFVAAITAIVFLCEEALRIAAARGVAFHARGLGVHSAQREAGHFMSEVDVDEGLPALLGMAGLA